MVYHCDYKCYLISLYCWRHSSIIGYYNSHLMAFSTRTWVGRYQKDKPFWIFLKQRWWGDSGISRIICKSFALRSEQINTPSLAAPHYSSFLWVGCSSCHPTNSIRAMRAHYYWQLSEVITLFTLAKTVGDIWLNIVAKLYFGMLW